MRLYPVPEWYEVDSVHKAVFFGPGDGHRRHRLKVPICKLLNRDEWPRSGCWEPADVSKRNWKSVMCSKCLKARPK